MTTREIVMGKLPFGCDLLEELTSVCRERNITLGQISAIGAVQMVKIGFYNQHSREYEFLSFDGPAFDRSYDEETGLTLWDLG